MSELKTVEEKDEIDGAPIRCEWCKEANLSCRKCGADNFIETLTHHTNSIREELVRRFKVKRKKVPPAYGLGNNPGKAAMRGEKIGYNQALDTATDIVHEVLGEEEKQRIS